MKLVKHSFFILLLKTCGGSILITSTVSLVMIFVGNLSFTVIRVLEELFPLDLKNSTGLMFGGFFILFIELMAYIISLIPINIALGIICGIIISAWLHFDFLANKLTMNKASILGGLVIGGIGSTNFMIQRFVLDTVPWKYSWDYIFSMHLSFIYSDPEYWRFYWEKLMAGITIFLGFYLGSKLGKILAENLLRQKSPTE